MAERCVHLTITGRVQGVGFRAWTARTAKGLGLDGWVRNRADGSVEAEASGDETAVDAFLSRCREGPPAAAVRALEVSERDEACPPGFEMKPTL